MPEAHAAPLAVMLVEDQPGEARLIREMLAELPPPPVHLEWVDTLAGGLRRLAAPGIDVVLLDLGLPDSQGLETLQAVTTRAPDVPVVVLSGTADAELALAAVHAGAQDYLVKGRVNGDVLLRVLRYAVERRRAEETQHFLAQATALLAASLDEEQTIATAARLPVPFLADGCLVDVFLDDRASSLTADCAADPQAQELLGEMRRRYPFDPEGPHPSQRVRRTGRSECHSELTDSSWETMAQDDEPLALLRQLAITSYVAVPLQARGRTFGSIGLFARRGSRRYEPADLAIIEELGRRVALAVDNARLYREAREAVQARDDVLAFTSHDLKNPLAAIRLQAELLERWLADGAGDEPSTRSRDQQAASGLARIQALTLKMAAMIEELVGMARLQAGRAPGLRHQPVDLVALARRTVDGLRPAFQRRILRLESGERELVGQWDATRLERVLDNLLSNARKYTPDEREVVVRLAREETGAGGWAVLQVRDRGVGIPPDELPYIFERFRRARNVEGRTQGSGVGLAEVRQIVEQHGGSILVESQEGEGSTFTVRLPLAPAAPGSLAGRLVDTPLEALPGPAPRCRCRRDTR